MIVKYHNPWRMGGTRGGYAGVGSFLLGPAAALTTLLDRVFPTDEAGVRDELEQAIAEQCQKQAACTPGVSTGTLVASSALGIGLGIAIGMSLSDKGKRARR